MRGLTQGGVDLGGAAHLPGQPEQFNDDLESFLTRS